MSPREMQQHLGSLLVSSTVTELLLRALYCKWAAEAENPQAKLFELIETTIGSLVNAMPDAADAGFREAIERELRLFGQQCQARLASLAPPDGI